MPTLSEKILYAIAQDRYIFGIHADEQLRQRRIVAWQIVAGVEDGVVLIERPNDRPNPIVELEQLLPDGVPIKAVWAWVEDEQLAKLVTVHFFDR